MLDNARPIHAIDIRERDGFGRLVDPDVDQADIVIEVGAQHVEGGVGQDAVELGLVGGAALLVEGVVLDEVGGDVGFEGEGGVLGDVEGGDEGGEEGALLVGGGGGGGAVGAVGFGEESGS